MRRILSVLTLLVFMSAGSAMAQKITSDMTDNNGVRTIFCERKGVSGFSDRMKMFIGLNVNSKPDGNNYCISVQLNTGEMYEVNKGGCLLLKTMKGDVVELSSYMGHKFDPTTDIETVQGIKMMTITVLYDLTEEQLDKLIADGVSKIRMEVVKADGEDIFEKEFKKDKIGDILKKEKKLITDSLNKKKPSFYEDF